MEVYGAKSNKTREDFDSQAEFEAQLHDAGEPFMYYDELIVTYGYTCMFFSIFTLSPFLALITFLIEIKIDKAMHLNWTQRPLPVSVDDIGSWYYIIEIMSQMSVVTNLVIVFFVLPVGSQLFEDDSQKVTYFLLIEHALFGFKFIIHAIIADAPPEIIQGLARQEYLERILVDGAEEDRVDFTAAEEADHHTAEEDHEEASHYKQELTTFQE